MNIAEAWIGEQGTGKSSGALSRILEIQRAHRCVVLVHDTEARFPRRGHDGRRFTFLREHHGIASAERGLERSLAVVHIIGTGKKRALDVWRLGRAVARSTGCQVLVWFDEIKHVEGLRSGEAFSDEFGEFWAVRRHEGVGIGYNTQRPVWAHVDLRSLLTAFCLYRVTGRRDLQTLADDGVPERYLEVVRRLRNFRRIRYEK